MIEFIKENISTIIEVTGLVLGLFYLYYEYKADNKVWLFAILMPMISMIVYYTKGIYADFGINIYYLITALYGYILWTRGSKGKDKSERPITNIGLRITVLCVFATAIFWGLIYLILANFTDSTIPIPDSFTTALSMVASWMLARKYLEQWIAWMTVDAVSVGLFIYKEVYFYAVLYSIYTIVAYLGYLNWKKKMRA